MQIGVFVSAVMAGLTVASLRSASAQESTYTRHAYESCKEAPSPEPGVIDVRRCPGAANIPVIWMGESDASSVSFGANPLDGDLELGAAFEVGTTIEWRRGKGDKRPVAAIVRYKTGDGVGNLNRSRLVVYRLEASGRSCVMGVVAGANANEKARAMVDGSVAKFACGKSKRLRM